MSPIQSDSWKRNGFTLLWDATALASIATPEQAISLYELFTMDGHWEETGLLAGPVLVVAGLDAMLDALAETKSSIEVEGWIEKSLKPLVMHFQTAFEGQKALVFWMPRGNERLNQNPNQKWRWRLGAGQSGSAIDLVRCLFAGAEKEVQRIDVPPDSFIGLHHRRIS